MKYMKTGLLFLMMILSCPVLPAVNSKTKISYSFENMALNYALQRLMKKFELPIVYTHDQVNPFIVTSSCQECTMEKALTQLLKDVPLSWKKVGDQFVLVKDEVKLKRHQKRTATLKGFIRNAANGETISYANIVIIGTSMGCASDENGYYVISQIPPKTYTIKVMMLGFEPQELSFNLQSGSVLSHDFLLKEKAIEMEAIVKTAERERFERQIEMSKIQMPQKEIESAPAFVEADLFRSLQTLPGVVAQSDFSSALYIRGGNPSENLIMLDDVRIYNPYHLGGIFSTFNTDAIKNVDISLGGFPARYGNAVSSVISVTNKDGNNQEFHGQGSISLLSSKLMLEGPIKNGSYLISARRTYFDVIYNKFIRQHTSEPENKMPYYFYDFHGKVNYRFSENSKLTLSGFYGDDVLASEDDRVETDYYGNEYVAGREKTEVRFGNYCSTAKWQYIFSPQLFSELILAKSRFRVKLFNHFEDERADANDFITDHTLKQDLTWYANPTHEIKMGLEFQRLNFDMNMRINDWQLLDYGRKANFFSGYMQDDWKVTPLLNIQDGLRLTYYSLGDYLRADPRISLRYRVQENLNLKGSLGVYHQYFYTFNPEDIDFLNYIRLIDLWFPIDQRYKPIRAIHTIAGAEYLWHSRYTFSVEGYYKNYDNLLDMNELSGTSTEDDFLTGYGQAYGLELMVRKEQGIWNGWVSYALAFTERSILLPNASYYLDNVDVKREYSTSPPSYDRRHSFSTVMRFSGFEKWDLSARYTYCSGLPETPVLGWKNVYTIEGGSMPLVPDKYPVRAARNSKRLPTYVRLDVSASRIYRFKSWTLIPFLQISNLTNHHNILLYNYNLESGYDPSGELKPARRQGVPMFPLVPTLGIRFEF